MSQAMRSVERLVHGRPTSDGAGVRLTRVLTQQLQRRLDPFLMLDAFASEDPADYIGGFPDHPHRGFETITYLLAGRMRHRDSAGNTGLLEAGGMQWMVAGSGLIHSELPEQVDGRLEGFQLWLNLPAADKMCPPRYRDVPAAAIPEYTTADGVAVRVIAGCSAGVAGAVQRPLTEPLYLDLHLPAGRRFTTPLAAGYNAFVYVYRGRIELASTTVDAGHLAILANDGDAVELNAASEARLILVAGRPLGEPIVQHGPFVMNTAEQIEQTLRDYRDGKFAAAAVQSL